MALNLTYSDMEKLITFIKKKTGIYIDDEKLERFKKRIENFLEQRGMDNFSSFYHRIRFQQDDELFQELINTVTINETYFWREYEQFDILSKEILPILVKNSSEKMPTIRILILPSSSGEELYSIMISILEEDNIIHKTNIELLGIDIDSKMISKAKKGVYTKRSVEKLPKKFLEKYFTRVGNFYQIDEKLRSYANFACGNIFDPNLVLKLGKFDVIFSRNMLIYFSREDKIRCLDIFYDILKEDGYLFLGHADANYMDKSKFQAVKSGFHIFKKKKM